jgi:hypothetical protein
LLIDAQLQTLAHELAGPTVAADFLNIADERHAMSDLIQRLYTDDGHGDGRMTLAGLRFLNMFPYLALPTDHGGSEVLGPAALMVVASRRELQNAYDQISSAWESAMQRPLREVDVSTLEEPALGYQHSLRMKLRYPLLAAFSPAMISPLERAERCLGERDGAEVGVALELYRRHLGDYPKDLGALVPEMLPAIPVDRITGEAVHYRIVDGKPIVYSVGADRKDDCGQPAIIRGERDLDAAARWRRGEGGVKGDWILYPNVIPVPEDER